MKPSLVRYTPGIRAIDRPRRQSQTADMAVRVLGPIEIDGGAPLSPRARTALCALVLRRPAVVSLDELADASWGPEPPATWPKQLQATIGHIRRALPKDAVVTC